MIGFVAITLIVLGCYEHEKQQNTIKEIDAYNRKHRELRNF